METAVKERVGLEVATDVLCLRTLIANVVLVGKPRAKEWVLVDGGVDGTANVILDAVADRFGQGSRPQAIILTHGHFDHVGTLDELGWQAPIYAHELELPYLTGKASYPPGDPTVDPGLMAKVSPLYPNKGVNLGEQVQELPKDGSVPYMPGWKWIHTPGHTPGHVALFRESDRVLIAGDAFVTVKQESAVAVVTQEQEVHGPPKYFTPNWPEAGESVRRLEALKPAVAVTGHGVPMRGDQLAVELATLARHFDELAKPVNSTE
jgi:glyoxylase-like metal-dependent hydrolase (beta-lactamase superfamily II)